MKLSLSNGRTIMMGMGFVPPPDEVIAMADSPELLEQAARERPNEELSQKLVDEIVGIKVTPVAMLTVSRENGDVETVVHMNRDELRRHIYDAKAVYDSMEKAADMADETWARYRERVRKEARDEPG